MTSKIFKLTLLIAAFAAAFTSCSKDDEAVSASQVAGDYVIVTATYLLNADGTITTTTGTSNIEDLLDIDFAKVTVSGKQITAINSDGELIFQSIGVVEASNGVAWNLAIPNEFVSEMRTLGYTVAGFEKYQVGDKKYQAFYNAKEKQIDFALAFINANAQIPDVVVEFVGSK